MTIGWRQMGFDRAELVCLMLMQRTFRERGEPTDWRAMVLNRRPPLPYWTETQSMPGVCPICRQLCYAGGAWRAVGPPKKNQRWHNECLLTYQLWQNQYLGAEWLWLRQNKVCATLGTPLEFANWGEVDHVVPLWKVQRTLADRPWPDVMRLWGYSNLRLLSRPAHAAKSAREAAERARMAADAGVTVEELLL